ncbi:MAG: hypothetical protein ACXADC_07975 [Candidatus Thorarchaeota archaeon]|jgi:hypothetical protein
MAGRFQELERIEEIISNDPENTPHEVRTQFWRIVREIKRTPKPNIDEVKKAASIRNMLFKVKRGRTLPLWPSVTLLFVIGVLGPTLWYLSLLEVPMTGINILAWTMSDWWIFLRRLGSLMGAIFFFYPFGRLIAGKWAGIRIDGMSRGMYGEPTLKIDYESFLLTSPAKRKWFFFFAGAWTIITSFVLGLVGLIQVGDLSGVITVLFLTISEGAVIISGTTKNIGGEMAHFNRERKIESAWKRNLAKMNISTNSTDSNPTTSRFMKRKQDRRSILLRGLALGLLFYFVWMLSFVFSTGLLHYHPDFAVYWSSSPAGSLFPIPHPPGPYAAIAPATMLDAFIFLVFINSGLWAIWISIFLFYILSPYTIKL